MLSQLELQKRNLESSLLFMQQEHSNTLKALHEEISKLQKKCSELTFQIAMHSSNEEAEEKEKKIEELTALFAETDSKRRQLENELGEKDSIIKHLQEEIKVKERKFLHDIKKRNQQVLALRADLDSKSGTIAYLTTEMHKLQVMQRSNDFVPVPTTSHSQSTNLDSGKHNHCKSQLTDISKRPITAKTALNAPDAELFLATTTTEIQEITVKPTPPVLPPISQEDKIENKFIRRQQLLRRRLEARSPPNYSSLAVDPITNSAQVLKPPTTSE